MQYVQNKTTHSFVKDSLSFVVTDFTGEDGGISGLRGLEEQSLSILVGGLIPEGLGSDFIVGCSATNSPSDNFGSDGSDFDSSTSNDSASDGIASEDFNSDILYVSLHYTVTIKLIHY